MYSILTCALTIIIGCALGWLSVWSGTLPSGLLTAALGALAGGAVAAMYVQRAFSQLKVGAAGSADTRLSPATLASLAVGLVIGVAVGQGMKDRLILGDIDPSSALYKWKATGLSDCELARAIFQKEYGGLPSALPSCGATPARTLSAPGAITADSNPHHP